MLKGFRGQPAVDMEHIEELLLKLSAFIAENPEIKEMDINPLLVHPKGQGATVADCRIILGPA